MNHKTNTEPNSAANKPYMKIKKPHTKSPWTADRLFSKNSVVKDFSEVWGDGKLICTFVNGRKNDNYASGMEVNANVCLVRKAPELLQDTRKSLKLLEQIEDSGMIFGELHFSVIKMIERLKKDIKNSTL